MSGGEVFLLVLLVPTTFLYWGSWFHAAYSTSKFAQPNWRLMTLTLSFISSLSIVLAVLLTSADPVVQQHPAYVVLFVFVAAVAIGAVNVASTLIGLSALDDAIRRPNAAAVGATGGVWIGTGLTVAGANIGRGETIGTTNGPLVLGVATLIALWVIWASVIGTSSIANDRDVSSGIRFASLYVAWGLILGRATAGDWVSIADTLRDFAVQGAPAVALLVMAIPIELAVRPKAHRPTRTSLGRLGPAVLYIAIAIVCVAWLGKP